MMCSIVDMYTIAISTSISSILGVHGIVNSNSNSTLHDRQYDIVYVLVHYYY